MSIFKIQIEAGNPAVFTPQSQTVNVNDSVFWHNADQEPHWPAPSAADPTGFIDFQIPPNTSSNQVTFPKAQTIPYICLKHPGETGQIVVQLAKQNAFASNTKKGAFADDTKKGAFADGTKKGALAENTKKGALAKDTKKGAYGTTTKEGAFGKNTKGSASAGNTKKSAYGKNTKEGAYAQNTKGGAFGKNTKKTR